MIPPTVISLALTGLSAASYFRLTAILKVIDDSAGLFLLIMSALAFIVFGLTAVICAAHI